MTKDLYLEEQERQEAEFNFDQICGQAAINWLNGESEKDAFDKAVEKFESRKDVSEKEIIRRDDGPDEYLVAGYEWDDVPDGRQKQFLAKKEMFKKKFCDLESDCI